MADAATAPPPAGTKKPAAPRDGKRETIETIVFVVVLVLLLKLFVTEAFVIPTGSMAETLYGYQKNVVCPKCGHDFPVNSHEEVEGRDGRRHPLVGCTCPNCRYTITFPPVPDSVPQQYRSPENRTGDRVLVLKPIYHVQPPHRGDVVVFKFPKSPQEKQTAQNYIKRAMGFGGETVGIHRGDLFVTRSLEYPADAVDASGNPLYPRPDDTNDIWRGGDSARGGPDYRYPDNQQAVDLFDKSRRAGFPGGVGGFEVVRKTEAQVLACRRNVWDNDQQPRELVDAGVKPRWHDPAGTDQNPWPKWKTDDPRGPRAFTHAGDDLDWVRYRHLAWVKDPTTTSPRLWTWADLQQAPPLFPEAGPVDNFLAYNAGMVAGGRPPGADANERLWVGDLILECEADVTSGAEVVLELSRGVNRYQARFAGGQVELLSTGPGGRSFGSRPCKVNGAGKYALRFANVDARLWVWVDNKLVDFGADADYPLAEPGPADGAEPEGWTKANDVAAPAGIGAKGGVTVRGVKVFRDIYYTRSGGDPEKADLYYVQPGHYLCLGDNSRVEFGQPHLGLVPERLMLGKAVFVFWPGPLEWYGSWPWQVRIDGRLNRIGLIK